MSGAVDIGWWIGFLIVAIPFFVAGWIARGMLERERAEEMHRSRMMHPSRKMEGWR